MSEAFKVLLIMAFLILCVWLSKVLFESIYYSSMPAWAKYMLLK